jgi:hypothetical protein
LSEPQDLGLGAFGIDGRQALTLAVDDAGRAVLAFDREEPATPFAEQGVLVSTRPPGGAFSAPVTLGARTVGPRVAVGSSGRALVASTALRDAYTYGNPVLVAVGPAGALGAPFGPAVARPRRTFRPSVAFLNGAASVLVFQVAASDGREEAPVHAVAITGDGTIGALQTLTAGLATEPVVLPLLNGRVLAVWRGGQRLGAAIAGPDGDFSRTAAPAGPPPSAYHSSSTNRHFATGGGFAIFAWARELEGRVRVSVRRFTSRGR